MGQIQIFRGAEALGELRRRFTLAKINGDVSPNAKYLPIVVDRSKNCGLCHLYLVCVNESGSAIYDEVIEPVDCGYGSKCDFCHLRLVVGDRWERAREVEEAEERLRTQLFNGHLGYLEWMAILLVALFIAGIFAWYFGYIDLGFI